MILGGLHWTAVVAEADGFSLFERVSNRLDQR
jgi:hypothetical protein